MGLYRYIVAIMMILPFLGCKSQHDVSKNFPEERLVFGSGGGMAGTVNTYMLLGNGRLFHVNSLVKDTVELEKVEKKVARSYFDKIRKLSLSEMDYDYPHNYYYFLEHTHSKGRHRVTWGGNSPDLPKTCISLYEELLTILK